jgi:hypothetical protein
MSDQVKERVREEELEEVPEERHPSTAEVAQALKQPERRETQPENEITPLLSSDKAENFRSRWTDIQAGFVDEPRHSVEQADSLVAEVMQYLAQTFADERQSLESQWGRGDNVSTEDLRIALQRYRSFFSRLLSV